MNYAALVAAVSSYTENTFPTVDMNLFITQAEKRIYNAVQLPNLRKTATTALTASTPYFNAPNDFLSVYSFAIVNANGSYTFLLNKDVNFIREAYPTPATTGTPKYYAIYGPQTTVTELQFILGPTPSAALATDLQYFAYPESIVTASNTWLSDNYDPVLLYGTLVEAYTYMKGEQDVILLYNTKFGEALTQLKRLGDGLERSDAYRSGQARVPVT
jgi:hypothetical protein